MGIRVGRWQHRVVGPIVCCLVVANLAGAAVLPGRTTAHRGAPIAAEPDPPQDVALAAAWAPPPLLGHATLAPAASRAAPSGSQPGRPIAIPIGHRKLPPPGGDDSASSH